MCIAVLLGWVADLNAVTIAIEYKGELVGVYVVNRHEGLSQIFSSGGFALFIEDFFKFGPSVYNVKGVNNQVFVRHGYALNYVWLLTSCWLEDVFWADLSRIFSAMAVGS